MKMQSHLWPFLFPRLYLHLATYVLNKSLDWKLLNFLFESKIFFFPTISGLAITSYQKNLPVNVCTGKRISIQENNIIWIVKFNKELRM